MHIVHVLGKSSRSAGGLLETVSGLANALQVFSLGEFQISVIGVFDEHFIADRAHWKCPIQAFSPAPWAPGKLLYTPGMLNFLLAENASVVFCHGLWTYHNRVVWQWSRRTRRPYVVVPHGMLDSVDLNKSRFKKWLAGRLYMEQFLHGAACIRAISESEAASIRVYGLNNPISLIPNGMNLPPNSGANPQKSSGRLLSSRRDDFLQSSHEPLECMKSLPANAKILFYIGRINPKKGLPALIEAWSQMTKSDPSAIEAWHLVIAGWDQDGHELMLKSQVKRLALDQTIHFAGPLFDAAKDTAFRNADAFILPSKSEGLPTVVLEAWAYGLPVLMTPQCNIPEGFTAAAAVQVETNVGSIAEGLGKLFLMSEAERTEMGANGRKLVTAKFSWSTVAQETMAVCNWIQGQAPKPASIIDD